MKKIIYQDRDGNGLSVTPNEDGSLFIEAGLLFNEDSTYYSGFIHLEKEDVQSLIKDLTTLVTLL